MNDPYPIGYEVATLAPPEPRVTECPTPDIRDLADCIPCDHYRTCTIYAEDARYNAADAARQEEERDGA
jgi:hypothetical protein